MIATVNSENTRAYIVGGGIAGLAAAAYLLREGRVPGKNIHIFEESHQTGGSLDAHGTPDRGYIMRGGRMFDEEAYTCTFDLMSFIPSLTDPEKTVKQELFEFNETFRSHAQSRLVANGQKVDVSSHGFSAQDRLDLTELMIQTEHSLGTRRIDEYFQRSFFEIAPSNSSVTCCGSSRSFRA
jgi:oleate hydratase